MNPLTRYAEGNPLTTYPFDAIAADYDTAFTHTRLGRWLREAVWERLGAIFQPGDHVLELGCGTGEDAVWLAQQGVHVMATDASPAMLEAARRKAQAAGVVDRINLARLDLASIDLTGLEKPVRSLGLDGYQNPQFAIRNSQFDGVFSNFGALNCLPDRRPVAEALARWVRPGGRVVLVLMGPFCPWEVTWHLLHGQVRTAFRRLRSGDRAHLGDGATVRVWYPSPRRLRAEFAPHFRHLETVGIGVLLPPTYLSHLVDRWPGLFARFLVVERRLAGWWPFNVWNDHYVIVLERRE